MLKFKLNCDDPLTRKYAMILETEYGDFSLRSYFFRAVIIPSDDDGFLLIDSKGNQIELIKQEHQPNNGTVLYTPGPSQLSKSKVITEFFLWKNVWDVAKILSNADIGKLSPTNLAYMGSGLNKELQDYD